MPPNHTLKVAKMETSLEVQWLGVQVSNAGSAGSIPGQRPRSHMCGTVKKGEKKFLRLKCSGLQKEKGSGNCRTTM